MHEQLVYPWVEQASCAGGEGGKGSEGGEGGSHGIRHWRAGCEALQQVEKVPSYSCHSLLIWSPGKRGLGSGLPFVLHRSAPAAQTPVAAAHGAAVSSLQSRSSRRYQHPGPRRAGRDKQPLLGAPRPNDAHGAGLAGHTRPRRHCGWQRGAAAAGGRARCGPRHTAARIRGGVV